MLGRRLLQGRQSSLSTIAKALARSNSTAATPAPAAASNPLAAQAPNYPTTWSTNQQPRPLGQSNPRFEQTAMETQPAPLSAMQLIAEEPIRLVDGRKAVCDGGNGPLGHPKIYINLDQTGPRSCGFVTASTDSPSFLIVSFIIPMYTDTAVCVSSKITTHID
ncbi:uncharacterized protein ARMOST_08968 [Armillaria ostoyae]|uniref:Zinc finger CHCC-type domain-containing protein n=1 Tax=Armillaria ostoyae TaxID=47428 RepID=A0A284RA78_ARMOS|nr:uncharacterized protein ARMOST_08968 [Armillaria ostoyae]